MRSETINARRPALGKQAFPKDVALIHDPYHGHRRSQCVSMTLCQPCRECSSSTAAIPRPAAARQVDADSGREPDYGAGKQRRLQRGQANVALPDVVVDAVDCGARRKRCDERAGLWIDSLASAVWRVRLVRRLLELPRLGCALPLRLLIERIDAHLRPNSLICAAARITRSYYRFGSKVLRFNEPVRFFLAAGDAADFGGAGRPVTRSGPAPTHRCGFGQRLAAGVKCGAGRGQRR